MPWVRMSAVDKPLVWLHNQLRVRDMGADWRIIYRVDPDVVVILEVFAKTTPRTPGPVVDACRRRLRSYDRA